MAKIIDYPRASLRAALQMAEAVDGFAGNCTVELAADKLGKKISGAFSAQISASVKYGLIESKAGKLKTTSVYREFKLAYTPEESAQYLQNILLSPPLFNNIYMRFKGEKLPISHFEKMLIREFDVPEEVASRVSHYFLEGAKQAGLLNNENALLDLGLNNNSVIAEGVIEEPITSAVVKADQKQGSLKQVSTDLASKNASIIDAQPTEDYWLNIRGPGINFSIEIKEEDDLEIVQIMLKKITKALNSNNEEI